MTYARILNNSLRVGLPKKGVLLNGKTVMGYNKLPEETLLAEGWLPYIEDKPQYDPEAQYLVRAGHRIEDNKIIQEFVIKEISFIEEHEEDFFGPDMLEAYERIEELEMALAELSLILGADN